MGSNGAKVAVLKDLQELARLYIPQVTVKPILSEVNLDGNFELQVAVHPQIYTASPKFTEGIQLLYFGGGFGNGGYQMYSIGVGSEQTGGGCIVHVHYEDSSRCGESIVVPLSAVYERILGGRKMPDSRPLEGYHSSSNEIFRNVPGSLEHITLVAFTTIKEHTGPVHMSG